MQKRNGKKWEAVVARIKQLEKEHGRLTPEIVVRDALRKTSPLHNNAGFVWDVKKAAMRHWISHAQDIIAQIHVFVKTTTYSYDAVAYVRDRSLPPRIPGYISTQTLKSDKHAASQVLMHELRTLAGHMRRVKTLAVDFDLEKHVEIAIAEISKMEVKLYDYAHRSPKKAQPKRSPVAPKLHSKIPGRISMRR